MNTKTCPKCGYEKSIDQFNKRYGKPQPYCRVCNSLYHKAHYKKHKSKYLKDTKDRRWQLRANALQFVMNYAKNGCEQCPEKDFRCIEFDHVDPTQKKMAIGYMVSQGYSIKTIHKELLKCRILCANCHKKRTAEQFGWYSKLIKLFKV